MNYHELRHSRNILSTVPRVNNQCLLRPKVPLSCLRREDDVGTTTTPSVTAALQTAYKRLQQLAGSTIPSRPQVLTQDVLEICSILFQFLMKRAGFF